jgi:hypothetical protein
MPDLGHDGLWAFAFVKDNKVIAIEKNGSGFVLQPGYGSNCIDYNHAKLVILNKNMDEMRILLIQDK